MRIKHSNNTLRTLAAMLLTVSLAALLAPSAWTAQHPGYDFDPGRSQGGIGKYYLDREISGVMGHQAAGWLERTQRTHEEMPDEVVANMGLEPHHVVADIGAGTGYFTFRIAEQVPQGPPLIQCTYSALAVARKRLPRTASPSSTPRLS